MLKAAKWVWALIKRIVANDLTGHAAEMAFFTMTAVFPFLLLLTAGIAFLEIPDLFERIMAEVRAIAPPETVDLIEGTVREVTTEKKTALALSTLLLSMWMSAGALNATTRGLNKAFGLRYTRTYFGSIAISMSMTLFLGVLLIGAILVLMLGPVAWAIARAQVDLGSTWEILYVVFRFGVPILFLFIAHAGIYWLCPAIERKFRLFTPGTVFSVLAWIAVSVGFQWWLTQSNNYDKFYGSLGTVVLTLMWFYLMSLVLLIGGQIDAMLHPELRARRAEDEMPKPAPFPWKFLLVSAAVVGLGAFILKTQVDSSSFTPRPTSIGGELAVEIAASRANGTGTFDSAELDPVLREIVDAEGLVNYARAREFAEELARYVDRAADADIGSLSSEHLHALLINLHNVAAIRLVIELDVDRHRRALAEMPDAMTRVVVTLSGKRLSLSDLQDRLLRHEFPDPRQHFALNEAARGSAPLGREAYAGERLEQQLEAATRRVLSGLEVRDKRVLAPGYVARYGEDFREASRKDIASWLAPYCTEEVRELLNSKGDAALLFTPFDRSLNASQGAKSPTEDG